MRNQTSSGHDESVSSGIRTPSRFLMRADKGNVRAPRLQRSLKENMALAIMVSALFAFPLALFAWMKGEIVPVVLTLILLGVGVHAYVSARRARFALATRVELFGIISGGLVLTFADPALVDAGLAVLLLVPVQLAISGGKASGRNIWVTLIALAIFSGVSAVGWLPGLVFSGSILDWTGAIYCMLIVSLQTYSAVRLYQLGRERTRAHNAAVRHLAEHMGDGYMRFSGDGKALFASKLTEKLLGAPRYELSGQGLLDRVHVLDRPVFLKGLSDSIHSEKTGIIEVRLRKDDQLTRTGSPEYIWIEIFFSPVRSSETDRKKWEVVALLRDVTRRKDHEFQIIEARRCAEQASKSKSGFLATIGHELRTPLNAIVGFSEMMTNGIGGTLEPAHEEYARLIHQSGHHLLDVVNMLLDMSKIEAGKFELHLSSFDPADLVQPCIQMVQTSACERNVTLETELAKNLPLFTADERACRQILINLLSNAVKFSHAGGTVQIRIKRQGQKLSLSVSDTGIGMNPEAARRVGEAFFQAHDGLARQYEGTGLGLSIVKGLVELHQGTIKFDSEVDRGTTVTVLLPINGPSVAKNSESGESVTQLKPRAQEHQPGHWPERKSIAS